MAVDMAAVREQNLQKSLLWMQQEHATTLKGLHEEIQKLQTKCADMTFKCAMDATSISQEDEYREKSEKLEGELKEERLQTGELEKEIEKKNKRTKMLEEQLRAQQKKYKDEVKMRNHTISQLQSELDTKSNSIAYLTTQLHAFKRAMKEKGVSRSLDDRPLSRQSIDVGRSDNMEMRRPTPPKEAAPKHRRRTRHVDQYGHPILTDNVQMRPASSRKLSDTDRPITPNSVLDPTPFLQAKRPDSADMRRSERAVLPPISKPGEYLITPQKTQSFTFVHKKKRDHNRGSPSSSSPEVEVETLAVDQLLTKDHSLRRAQEYNGD